MNKVGKEYKWYAIYTITNHEKSVCQDLEKNGIESYLPLVRSVKRWSDREKIIESPLFKSYVFVNVSCREYFKALIPKAALKYVCFDGTACPIPEEQIDSLRRIVNSNYPIQVIKKDFRHGQKVRIDYGPLKNCSGEIVRSCSKNRFLIKLEGIEYSIMVNIPSDSLQKVLI